MRPHWMLVADRAGARLFGYETDRGSLELVQDLPHPEGRLRNHDLLADRPGRSFDRKGPGRHSMEVKHDATAHESGLFARELARILDDGRQANSFDHLYIVAAPRFLGQLRESLSKPTLKLLRGSIDKDLTAAGEPELLAQLQGLLSSHLGGKDS